MKVAIYCRISHEDKNKYNDNDDSESIQNQRSLLTNYAVNKGWNIYKIYIDDDYSGMDNNRPSFKEMINDAKNKRIDVILCKSQSRFTRDLSLVEEYINDKFIQWGIRFVTIVDYVDNFLKGSRKQRQINGLVNQWYIEDTSDNIRAVLDNKRKEGYHIGGTARFGYLKDPDNKGKIIIDPVASVIVKKIFSMAENGLSTIQIAKELNRKNILKPAIYKKIYINKKYKNAAMRTNRWTDKIVRNILKEPMYLGNMVQGRSTKASIRSYKKKEVSKEKWIIKLNTHTPIISQEQFDNVQLIINSRGKVSSIVGKKHIFSGKIKCGYCGGTLKKLKNGSGNYYFKCARSLSPIFECDPKVNISYNKLTYIVTELIKEKIKIYCDFDKISHDFNELKEYDSSTEIKKSIDKLKSEYEKKSSILTNMYTDKISGLISEKEFLLIKNKLLCDIEYIANEIKRIEESLLFINTKLDIDKYRNEFNKIINMEEINYRLINGFIKKIVVYSKSDLDCDHRQKIAIYWNF